VIFVTVGTQLPFDRLVKSVDLWAGENSLHKIVVQSGISDFSPKNCESSGYIEPFEWEQLFLDADFVIAHAGMGTILKCIDACKPLIIMPRKGSLGEHRNDHQIATASKFIDTSGIIVISDENKIADAIEKIESREYNPGSTQNENLDNLINELRSFSGIEEQQ